MDEQEISFFIYQEAMLDLVGTVVDKMMDLGITGEAAYDVIMNSDPAKEAREEADLDYFDTQYGKDVKTHIIDMADTIAPGLARGEEDLPVKEEWLDTAINLFERKMMLSKHSSETKQN